MNNHGLFTRYYAPAYGFGSLWSLTFIRGPGLDDYNAFGIVRRRETRVSSGATRNESYALSGHFDDARRRARGEKAERIELWRAAGGKKGRQNFGTDSVTSWPFTSCSFLSQLSLFCLPRALLSP